MQIDPHHEKALEVLAKLLYVNYSKLQKDGTSERLGIVEPVIAQMEQPLASFEMFQPTGYQEEYIIIGKEILQDLDNKMMQVNDSTRASLKHEVQLFYKMLKPESDYRIPKLLLEALVVVWAVTDTWLSSSVKVDIGSYNKILSSLMSVPESYENFEIALKLSARLTQGSPLHMRIIKSYGS